MLPGPDNMALIVPEVSACSRFTINSCPSDEISFTYMASGPSHPPKVLSSSPSLASDIVTGGMCHFLGKQNDTLCHNLLNTG